MSGRGKDDLAEIQSDSGVSVGSAGGGGRGFFISFN